jgi:hypothetical protein
VGLPCSHARAYEGLLNLVYYYDFLGFAVWFSKKKYYIYLFFEKEQKERLESFKHEKKSRSDNKLPLRIRIYINLLAFDTKEKN